MGVGKKLSANKGSLEWSLSLCLLFPVFFLFPISGLLRA